MRSDATPILSVIIISYNTCQMTLDCLRALLADVAGMEAEVMVVDNASTDGSPEAIEAEFGPRVRVIRNDRNAGFGAANNIAMRGARGKYFLLLNSDAFVKAGAVGELVRYLDDHADVGVVGPRLLNGDGSVQVSCFPFPSPLRAWVENLWIPAIVRDRGPLGDFRRWAHDREREVPWVIGACLLARREVHEQVGGFDERFFMYAEETDWQRRIRDAGWRICFTPAAEVTHLGGASGAGGINHVRDRRPINRGFFESLDYYERKHHGSLGLISLRAAMTVGGAIRVVLWSAMLIAPSRRPLARAKLRLLSWLVVRQMTDWNVRPGAPIDGPRPQNGVAGGPKSSGPRKVLA